MQQTAAQICWGRVQQVRWRGVYVAKGEYSKYAEDGVYSAKGKYSKKAKEDASVEEGHNEPLAKEGNDKPFAKDGNWLGTTMSPLPQGQLAAYTVQCNNEPLTTIGDWDTTFNDHEGAKALTIKLIVLNHDPLPLQWSAIAPAMMLVFLHPPLQQMRRSTIFCVALR